MELLGGKIILGFSANPLEAPLGPLGISGPNFENHWFSPPTHNFTALITSFPTTAGRCVQ